MLHHSLSPQHGETALHIASKFSQPEVIGAFSDCDTNMNVMMEVSVAYRYDVSLVGVTFSLSVYIKLLHFSINIICCTCLHKNS